MSELPEIPAGQSGTLANHLVGAARPAAIVRKHLVPPDWRRVLLGRGIAGPLLAEVEQFLEAMEQTSAAYRADQLISANRNIAEQNEGHLGPEESPWESWITAKQAGELLERTPERVIQLHRFEGLLPSAIKNGGQWMFRRDEVLAVKRLREVS